MFPRTSLNSSHPVHFQKHNKRLGKVSHQMQKIIDDIQGKSSSGIESRRIEPKRSSQRKSVEMREIEYAEYIQRRSQRRKSRKHPGSDGEHREMACQTTIIKTGETSTKLTRADHDSSRPSLTQNSHSLDRITRTHRVSKSNSLDRNPRSPGENYRKNIKRSKFEEVKVKMAPWERPLPPVPVTEQQTTDSQAKLYQKVYQTVTTRLKAEGKNLWECGQIECQPKHAMCIPVKSISKQIAERNETDNIMRLRYVDIENVSSDRKSKQKVKDSDPNPHHEDVIFKAQDEEHIYESIEDEDGYETIENSKCRELFPNSPITAWNRFRHSDIGLFTPERTPDSIFRHFRHEDTYLEPVCSLNDMRYNNRSRYSVSSDDQGSQYDDQISDFQGYVRDFVVSPTNSSVSAQSVTIRPTYV